MAAGRQTWTDAKKFCDKKPNLGWGLATIASAFENRVVASMIRVSQTKDAWIGLAVPPGQRSGDPPNGVSPQHTAKFVWDAGSARLNFSNLRFRNWARNKPGNANGAGEPPRPRLACPPSGSG